MGLLACSLAVLMAASGPAAPKTMETTLQDDALFLHRPPAEVAETARRVAQLGADRVRLTAGWSVIAPEPRSRRRPGQPFDATDSRTYPAVGWERLDEAIRASDRAGLQTQVDLAFWAPRWAVRKPSRDRDRERNRPDPQAFGQFAAAAARRYDGTFPDPQNRKRSLPAVRLWTTWNEPNHPAFLSPQWRKDGRGGFRPASPHTYRAMHEAAYDALKKASPANRVLLGGTASTGSHRPGRGGVPPLKFARALACVDDALRPLRVPECKHFKPLRADGWSHHPYSRYVPPDTPPSDPDNAQIADVGRLGALLDTLHQQGRITTHLDLYQTEFAYESSEDDPYQRFTREQQARFIGWSTFLAYRDPSTVMFSQFLLRDIDPRQSGRRPGTRGYYRDFQSGLLTAEGNAKPAAQAFRLPFWAQTVGEGPQRAVLLFGEVRPGGTGSHVVRVERQDPATGAWAPVVASGEQTCEGEGDFLTDSSGVFLRFAPFAGPGTYRFSWRHRDGRREHSVAVGVAADAAARPPV